MSSVRLDDRRRVSGRRPTPVNKLTAAECAEVVEVLNSDRFVDAAPMQVWATLLDEGTHLCSISTMYRLLNANSQVKERRRLARHRKAVCPELVATAPRQVYKPPQIPVFGSQSMEPPPAPRPP